MSSFASLPQGVQIVTLDELIDRASKITSSLGMMVDAQTRGFRSIVPTEDGDVALTANQWEGFKVVLDLIDGAALAAHEAVEDIREAHAGGVR